jgi:hypothetical protein
MGVQRPTQTRPSSFFSKKISLCEKPISALKNTDDKTSKNGAVYRPLLEQMTSKKQIVLNTTLGVYGTLGWITIWRETEKDRIRELSRQVIHI